jgi:hypothetical protein
MLQPDHGRSPSDAVQLHARRPDRPSSCCLMRNARWDPLGPGWSVAHLTPQNSLLPTTCPPPCSSSGITIRYHSFQVTPQDASRWPLRARLQVLFFRGCLLVLFRARLQVLFLQARSFGIAVAALPTTMDAHRSCAAPAQRSPGVVYLRHGAVMRRAGSHARCAEASSVPVIQGSPCGRRPPLRREPAWLRASLRHAAHLTALLAAISVLHSRRRCPKEVWLCNVYCRTSVCRGCRYQRAYSASPCERPRPLCSISLPGCVCAHCEAASVIMRVSGHAAFRPISALLSGTC